MSGSAVMMMLVICGIVWGGFVFFLIRAIRSEGKKLATPGADDQITDRGASA